MNGIHGIIFTYERRGNLQELVSFRSAASIPFGGRFRAVNFALSNLVNAGATDVGIILHGQYQSLLDYLGTGKEWDLSRKRGGLRLLPPFNYQGDWGSMPYRGHIEALAGVRSYLESIRQDYVVMMDGDLVANLPISEIFEEHIKSGADITAVCANDSFMTEDGTYFQVGEGGRVTEVFIAPHTPRGLRGLGTYVVSKKLLLEVVDDCIAKDHHSWRGDVLQARKGELKIQTYIWKGYAAQIRSVQEYYDRSMQLLDPAIRTDLFCPQRPIRAKNAALSSTYIGSGGKCVNSLVGDGCSIEGVVENSILFSDVTVEAGAVIRNCVIFKDSIIRKDAQLSYIIADKNVEILPGRTLMGHATYPIVLAKGSRV